MSKTRNHRTSKSNWKKSCKKVTNRKIRHSKMTEITGLTKEEMLELDMIICANINYLTADEAQQLFDYVDNMTLSEESFIPTVSKFRFYMD